MRRGKKGNLFCNVLYSFLPNHLTAKCRKTSCLIHENPKTNTMYNILNITLQLVRILQVQSKPCIVIFEIKTEACDIEKSLSIDLLQQIQRQSIYFFSTWVAGVFLSELVSEMWASFSWMEELPLRSSSTSNERKPNSNAGSFQRFMR